MTKKKDKVVSVRVSDLTFQQAEEKAKREGVSISSILRSFLHMWAHDETPKGYPPIIKELDKRAPEARPRNIKRGKKQDSED